MSQTDSSELPPPPEYDEEPKPSRFSDDEVETEIEVEAQDNDSEEMQKKKRKKKKRPKKSEDENGTKEEKKGSKDLRKTLSCPEDEESMSEEKPSKGKSLKQKFRRFRTAPLLFLIGCKICVLLPIAIYACDVIIAMNSLEDKSTDWFKKSKNNISMLRLPNVQFTSDFPYDKTLLKMLYATGRDNRFIHLDRPDSDPAVEIIDPDTIVVPTLSSALVQSNSSDENSNQTSPTPHDTTINDVGTTAPVLITSTSSGIVSTSSPNGITSTTFTEITTTTSNTTANPATPVNEEPPPTSSATVAMTTSGQVQSANNGTTTNTIFTNTTAGPPMLSTNETTTSSSTNITEQASVTSASTTIDVSTTTTAEATTVETTQTTSTAKPRFGYCEDMKAFYKKHQDFYRTDKKDWLQNRYSVLNMSQQALFYMFVIGGFLLLMMNIVMRSEMFLNSRWSSFILFHFLFYAISASISAHMFTLVSSRDGIRCFLCQSMTYCDDINPWYLGDQYFPSNGINWTLVVFISYILKAYDCYVIAIVTLTYTIDAEDDRWYHVIWKIVGWLIFFPLIVFTPLLGVLKFEVLPSTLEQSANEDVYLAMSVLFWAGIGLWGLVLIVVPIFCKLRMCNDQEEEDEY